ncbi:MAG: Error-prone DNA polymerase [Candidatus Accumulibacter appositus]|uniref:Error-prone DNA polymerase n=1 Tax=Candidatus Accumulibacter appositus TaxID=1454003 RepID=A0A011PZV9_9PROT|nr:error-prone DNA polymerase [Accumulibacter sp.]EXI82455.1 MAG: Error-prone DNA polymerase [Candidatus Accumulibacter appositus]HRF03013.1 error-prone DNA polymerase [Accumulibacter sp.]
MSDLLPPYVELHCCSNFSFLRGASHPEELVEHAQTLGYSALAITDEASLAGVVRAHRAASARGLPLLIGAEFRLSSETGTGLRLLLLAQNRAGYGNLSALITLARRRSPKGQYRLSRGDLESPGGFAGSSGALPDCLALWIPDADAKVEDGRWLATRFPTRSWLAVELHSGPDDATRLAMLLELATASGLPAVAAGDVHMHRRARRPLQDTLTAIRLKSTLFAAGHALFANGERHLRSRLRLARLYPPELLAETLNIAARCDFSLAELRYEYPDEVVPAGQTAPDFLRAEVEKGLRRRYPGGETAAVRERVEHELALIRELAYEPYFLTVYDLVNFARSRNILCQGRGSAANSAVCYCLGITEVDPARSRLLFERFISRERGEPPDIDVDFEHQRREEVIQYLYLRYGRERAALTATVITYRTRAALRDVGRALGFGSAQIDALTTSMAWWDKREQLPERLRAAGLDAEAPRVAKWLALSDALRGFPRHLSQHVGGFVISRGPLARLVPIENAAMPERTVIQWDKDDLDALGLLKVDVLALGMLSAIHRALDLVGIALPDVPPEDPAVYDMLCAADTIGVFQIESRAQMAMLPRLRPRSFYDLVIEVALVRPGPIQGDMVHPYLRRRHGQETIEPMRPEIAAVLGRTCGVPIFQEQVMQLAVVAGGFTPGEADQLRRAMAAWRRKGGLEPFEEKLISGMRQRGHDDAFAQRVFAQIRGFGEYGFPESHAASFALLVYVSAWLKRHHPAAFLCALLNSQPMGFYSPSQLLQDARRHGVDVRPVTVNESAWEARLESTGCEPGTTASTLPAVRLGLSSISGLAQAAVTRLLEARQQRPLHSVANLATRARLTDKDLALLAAAGALACLAGHRRQAAWLAAGSTLAKLSKRPKRQLDLLGSVEPTEAAAQLATPSEAEELIADYAATGFTLGRHPLTLLRSRLSAQRFVSASELQNAADRQLARAAGIVTCRQRPGTASGIVFVTLEDETGLANIVVHSRLVEQQRHELLAARLLGVLGQVQREGQVVHLVAKRLVDLSALLGRLPTTSRNFH